MNKILSFDTLKYANRLKQINVPPEQAELQAEVMKEVLESAFQTAELVTKSDLRELQAATQADIRELQASAQADIQKLEAATSAEFALVRKEMEAMEQRLGARIDAGNAKVDAMVNRLLIQMIGIIFAGIGATAAIVALLPKLFS